MSQKERWRLIAGSRYEVSDLGNVRNAATFRHLTQVINPHGFKRVTISAENNSFFLHNLVLVAFVGEVPEGHGPIHVDRDRTNNVLSNLRWELLKTKHPLYSTWKQMCLRCKNPRGPKFHLYGGRGIKVCERWQKFENFLADMGERPAGTTLDRFPDKDGDYENGNCRWATPLQQTRNSRKLRFVEFDGRTQCITDWAAEFGISPSTLIKRITKIGINKAMLLGRNKAPWRADPKRVGSPVAGKA